MRNLHRYVSARSSTLSCSFTGGLLSLTLWLVVGIVLPSHSMAQERQDPNKLLTEAVEKNDLLGVQEALRQGAVPDKSLNGDLPVSCRAAFLGRAAILKALLDHGANPNFRSETDGTSLLIYGAFSANPEVIRMLLDRKVDVNVRNSVGETALNAVGEQEPPKPSTRAVVMRMLLHAGADPELHGRDGRTAIVRYADYGIRDGVAVLAAAGANIDARDRNGDTALTLAAGWLPGDTGIPNPSSYLVITRCLLRHGANLNARNHDGLTALEAARQNGHPAIVSLLLEHGATDDRTQNKNHPLAADLIRKAMQIAIAMPGYSSTYIDRSASYAAIEALAQIAERQAQAGDRVGALQTIRLAKERIEKSEDRSSLTYPLALLTGIQAQMGDVAGARQAVADLPDGSQGMNVYSKDLMRQGIVLALAKTDAIPEAQQMADSIQNDRLQHKALLAVAEAQKQEGDSEGAQETLRTVRQAEEKRADGWNDQPIWNLLDIAQAQSRAGDSRGAQETLQSALQAARKANAPEMQSRLLHDIAVVQAQMRLTTDALQTAHTIRDADTRAWALVGIARAQVQAGDAAGARHTLNSAQQTVTTIPDAAYRNTALAAIVQVRLEAHDLSGAIQIAKTITAADPRDTALLAIAQAQVETHDLRGALRIAAAIRSNAPHAHALARIATLQSRNGAKADAARTLRQALSFAQRIDIPAQRVPALLAIAQAQAHSGSSFVGTLRAARQTAQAISIPDDRSAALQEVAETQAALGDKAGAEQTTATIEDARNRIYALLAVAEIVGKR